MKLFKVEDEEHTYQLLAAEVSALVTSIVELLHRSPRKQQLVQIALFVFHVHAKLTTYHKFDRFVYACAAVLFAGKITEQIEYPMDIVRACRGVLRRKRGKEMEGEEGGGAGVRGARRRRRRSG